MHKVFYVVVVRAGSVQRVSGPWASRDAAEESQEWYREHAVDSDEFWQDASITIDEVSSESPGMQHPKLTSP